MSDSHQKLDDWLGTERVANDLITAFPLAALAATLDREQSGDTVPPLWHWLYFLPIAPMSEAGPDGHPKRGDFLPPVPLPRRMWAGGRITFHAPLKVGERATRTSTIANIEDKTGRSGRLVFVTVQHSIAVGGELKLEEEHDIVYRDAPLTDARPQQPQLAPQGERWSRIIEPDPVMLFRYSALTFNSHRIHYDYPYATQVEAYPGLVVHGPLIATLLVDLVRRQQPDATLQSFAFKALRPTFSGQAFMVCGAPSSDGKSIDLWAKDHDGYLTMRATAAIE
ncbi:FAS1-like dehydratase domain-containing protein [Paraburkholderia strydomiana]|uniref:FAS1-like dehydratase domain-containing protein n=1 Tax=Paraburkholderia strydomiana TaxID=1245417 RepID=UPI001BE66FBD|nr:MaoC family dehydratase N-terminal domain-containing protein [Paraburkholderia strydomiana]MBT2793830.1 MaoC family dehydratase N-terminal domain-containing protein [Paraburkholderia strydomiana]